MLSAQPSRRKTLEVTATSRKDSRKHSNVLEWADAQCHVEADSGMPGCVFHFIPCRASIITELGRCVMPSNIRSIVLLAPRLLAA